MAVVMMARLQKLRVNNVRLAPARMTSCPGRPCQTRQQHNGLFHRSLHSASCAWRERSASLQVAIALC